MRRTITAFLLIFICILDAGAQERSLDFYISEGLQNSPILKDFQNQIETNIQDSLLLKAIRKPNIGATGQILVAPNGTNFGYDEAITNGGNYSAVVGVSQNLFMKNRMNNLYAGLDLESQSAKNNSKITDHELKKMITNQYLVASSQYAELLFARDMAKLLNDEEKILKQLTANGVYKQTDYFSFLIEKQQQDLNVLQLQINYKQELYKLNFICGIEDTTVYFLAEAQIDQIPLTNIANTPYYQKFVIDSLLLVNSQQEISLKYKPTLELFADMGINSVNPWQSYKFFGFSVGLNFTLPIYDGKQKTLELEKIKIADDTRKSYSDFYHKQYTIRIVQLQQKVKSYNIILSELEKQISTISTLIEMNKLQLNTGELSITDYILTIRNYIEAKHQFNVLSLEKMQMINELNYIVF